jgi:PHD and RING finger domain-containing protein 1
VNSSSSVADCPPHRLAAGVQKVEISDGRGHKLEQAGHADDEHGSVDVGEQVTGHLCVDNSRDGDSVKCPVCSVTFTAQEVGTPVTCDHTFCAACFQEWSKNEHNCPVDRQIFNFILVWHNFGGEIIMRTPVDLPRWQSECDHEDRELPCQYKLGYSACPAIIVVCLLFLC